MNFHKRIRDIREDRDYLQKDIANVLQITTQQYQLYESGQRDFKYFHIIKLSEFYKLSADYILGLIDEQKPLK